jgi:hypothetical protein
MWVQGKDTSHKNDRSIRIKLEKRDRMGMTSVEQGACTLVASASKECALSQALCDTYSYTHASPSLRLMCAYAAAVQTPHPRWEEVCAAGLGPGLPIPASTDAPAPKVRFRSRVHVRIRFAASV